MPRKIFYFLILVASFMWTGKVAGQFTPFRDPFMFSFGNVAVGLSYLPWNPGTTIKLDSLAFEVPQGNFWNRTLVRLRADLFRYNWLYRVFPQAWVDLPTGIGITHWWVFNRVPLPDNWPQEFTEHGKNYKGLQFSPAVWEIHISQSFLYPVMRNMLVDGVFTAGYAWLWMYQNDAKERAYMASAPDWGFLIGVHFLLPGDAQSRFAAGFNVGYFRQRFTYPASTNSIRDYLNGEYSSPIREVDASRWEISFDLRILLGGYRNEAYHAHQVLEQGDYLKAAELYEQFLNKYPHHHNRKLVQKELERARRGFAKQYLQMASAAYNSGKFTMALLKMELIPRLPDSTLIDTVERFLTRLSDTLQAMTVGYFKQMRFQSGEKLLDNLARIQRLEQRLFRPFNATGYTDTETLKNLWALDYFTRAYALYAAGVYERALAWAQRAAALEPEYEPAVAELQKEIGAGKIADANRGILRQDTLLVLESMREAKELDPRLALVVDEHIQRLEKVIKARLVEKLERRVRAELEAGGYFLDSLTHADPNFMPYLGLGLRGVLARAGPPDKTYRLGPIKLWVYRRERIKPFAVYFYDDAVIKVWLLKRIQSATR